MLIRTVFVALLSATIFVSQAVASERVATWIPAKANETAHEPTNRDPVAINAVVTHHGAILGAAADARARAFLNESGLPH
jgi:hypothetical protein